MSAVDGKTALDLLEENKGKFSEKDYQEFREAFQKVLDEERAANQYLE